jgi:hypothetical protein
LKRVGNRSLPAAKAEKRAELCSRVKKRRNITASPFSKNKELSVNAGRFVSDVERLERAKEF